jgi:hypothetical protein
MAALNGDEVNERMEGSTSAITGEAWHNNADKGGSGDTYFKTGKDGTEYMSKSVDSNKSRQHDHIHYYNDKDTGVREAKVTKHGNDPETGKSFKDKTSNDGYLADNLFEGVKNFLGF